MTTFNSNKNILLIDVDSKIPNLALMKLSKYHKKKGDRIGFKISNPDKIYGSIIFKKNGWKGRAIKNNYNCEVQLGGSGYDENIKLPKKIEQIEPDYSLYPKCDYSIGFTTRGCGRNCYFCIVPRKEGKFKRHMHPKKFHKEKFNKIKLLDNNILFDKDWFFEVTDWIIEKNLSVEFNQGLDIRLLDRDIAKRIKELNTWKPWKFAFDRMEDKNAVLKGIEILKEAGMNVRNDVMFYVYCHNETHIRDALKRCNILKNKGTNPFVMCNIDKERTQKMIDFQRWANRKELFWSMPFSEYKSLPKQKINLKNYV